MGPITFVDVALAIVVFISAVIGMARGLVREVLGAFAWIGALLATLFGFNNVRPFARDIVGNIPYREVAGDALAGAGIFLSVLIILSLISNAVSSLVRDSALSGIDRIFGLVFGFLRGVVLLVLAFAAWQMVWSGPAPAWLAGAAATRYLEAGAGILRIIVPAGTAQSLGLPNDERRRQIDQIIEGGRALEQLAPAGSPSMPSPAPSSSPSLAPSLAPAPSTPVQSAPLPPAGAVPPAGVAPPAGAVSPVIPPSITRPAGAPQPGSAGGSAGGGTPAEREALDRLIRGRQQ